MNEEKWYFLSLSLSLFRTINSLTYKCMWRIKHSQSSSHWESFSGKCFLVVWQSEFLCFSDKILMTSKRYAFHIESHCVREKRLNGIISVESSQSYFWKRIRNRTHIYHRRKKQHLNWNLPPRVSIHFLGSVSTYHCRWWLYIIHTHKNLTLFNSIWHWYEIDWVYNPRFIHTIGWNILSFILLLSRNS